MNPRLLSCSSSAASSKWPWRICRKTFQIPARISRLTKAMAYRNVPETVVPIQPVTLWSAELSFSTGSASDFTPSESRKASANTMLEWPSENQKPTDSGRLPSPISLRVVLSMAAMWSASKACRIPRV